NWNWAGSFIPAFARAKTFWTRSTLHTKATTSRFTPAPAAQIGNRKSEIGNRKFSWRFRVPDGEAISFVDGHFGPQRFVAGKLFGSNGVWGKMDSVPVSSEPTSPIPKRKGHPRASVCAGRCCPGSAATGLHSFLHAHVEARTHISLVDTSRGGTTRRFQSTHT